LKEINHRNHDQPHSKVNQLKTIDEANRPHISQFVQRYVSLDAGAPGGGSRR